MHEEKVEDMKAIHALRMNTIQLQEKPCLALAEVPREMRMQHNLFGRVRLILAAIWDFRKQPDLDLESWREIEFRNEREPRRDPRMIDLGRWY
jgi:hypothetical protein